MIGRTPGRQSVTGDYIGGVVVEIVSRACERFSLIVITNLSFEHWTEVMGSEG